MEVGKPETEALAESGMGRAFHMMDAFSPCAPSSLVFSLTHALQLQDVSNPNHLKAPLPNTTWVGQGFNLYILAGGHKHSTYSRSSDVSILPWVSDCGAEGAKCGVRPEAWA